MNPALYAELRRLAHRVHADHRRPDLIQPTELLHEAWIKLDRARAQFRDREHFIAVAARAMRQILVDRARRRMASKRGGGLIHTTITGLADASRHVDVLEVEAATAKLEGIDRQAAEVFVARALGGLTIEETAGAMGISRTKVARKWRFARAFMIDALAGE